MASPKYTLLYHPGIPGRAEPIRLAFEATHTPYHDLAKTSSASKVYSFLGASTPLLETNPPILAPPLLKVSGAGKNGSDLLISQTANILSYLGKPLGLAGAADGVDEYHVAQVAMTALDLLTEAHDTHHPIASSKYYEDQKSEALTKSKEFREVRVPKLLGYFENVLKANEKEGRGEFLVGGKLTYADLVLWQVLDGLKFAFPKEMAARERAGEFPNLCGKFYSSIKEADGIKEYLASEKRAPYSQGIFRLYPELDRQ